MVRTRQSKLNAQISEEAAEWFVEFRTGEVDARSRAQFDAWVRSSPEHLRAYLEMAAIWNESRSLNTPKTFSEVDSLTNVVDLTTLATPAIHQNRGTRRRYPIAASLAAVLVAAGTLLWYQLGRIQTYVTGVGEQRSIRLDDGSTMELNSRSRIRVVFSEHERRIELVSGQALFQVAKDRARPFTVRSGGTRIIAVGTQFDVNRKRESTIVTVLEGRVAVSSTRVASRADTAAATDLTKRSASLRGRAGDSTQTLDGPTVTESADNGRSQLQTSLMLDAGEQVTLSAQAIARPVRTNVAAVTAWTQNQIVLESVRLADVAEEFNRYSARLLVAEDHAHPQLRLSGVFSTDPQFLIRYLRERPDITIRETQTEIHITRHE